MRPALKGICPMAEDLAGRDDTELDVLVAC